MADTESGTWCARNVPSTGRPSMTFGPVHPLSDRRTIIGQRGRVASPWMRASCWICLDLLDDLIEGCGHGLMHLLRVVSLDEVRRPAAAAEELVQFFVGDAHQDGWVGDLVAVEMQDRQHDAVAHWVEELVGVP